MPYRNQIESDGQTVYISGSHSGGWMGILGSIFLLLLATGLFGWVLLELTQERGGLIIGFLLIRFAAYPVLRRMIRTIVVEDIELGTQQLTARLTYGFIRGRKHILPYHKGQLATGAEPVNKEGSLFQVAWFTDASDDSQEPRMLHQHFFPMTSTDYETIKTYVQELFDLEASNDYELLFSAN
ncbi:MAG: hypothetical protein EOP52_08735 [Sphingobacteriales bacterium]|nr:MAG: hypothetical protein EOP52_08735 [Sphingobacteriales bacterium]